MSTITSNHWQVANPKAFAPKSKLAPIVDTTILETRLFVYQTTSAALEKISEDAKKRQLLNAAT